MTLVALGFTVAESPNGEAAIGEVDVCRFDAVLMDVNMPGMGGIEACRRIRQINPQLQILMLTVRDGEADKVEALNAGADDYIVKPFSIPELVARLRSAVRRSATAAETTPIIAGDVELDMDRRTVRKRGALLRLTPKEFNLLRYLVHHRGLPVPHSELLRAVWGSEYGQELEYLRTFVHQLRKKLEDDPAAPEFLLTEPHFGYRFREP